MSEAPARLVPWPLYSLGLWRLDSESASAGCRRLPLAALGLAWTLSSGRRAIPWRTVLGGIGLQLALALLIFRLPGVREIFRRR
jgi:hypothetical protein